MPPLKTDYRGQRNPGQLCADVADAHPLKYLCSRLLPGMCRHKKERAVLLWHAVCSCLFGKECKYRTTANKGRDGKSGREEFFF